MKPTYRIVPDWIRRLDPGQCFVFGANTEGRHGAGAARIARVAFGARQGQTGDMGSTWGIVTKDLRGSYPLDRVLADIRAFLDVARSSPEREFLVTPIGCGLAGFTPDQIAPAFRDCPPNVLLPKVFVDVLMRETTQ